MRVQTWVAAQTDTGLVRGNNEDAFLIADLSGGNLPVPRGVARFDVGERGVLLAVSDGLGGARAGEVASALVVESMRRSLESAASEVGPVTLVREAVERANLDCWEAAQHPEHEGMGATLTAIYLCGATAHIAEVGDSRAYLVRGGRIRQVTRDQSYVQLLLDAGAIDQQEADSAPFKNVVLQAMGQRPDVSVALGRLALRDRDCLLLCSDGLSNKVADGEMRDIVLSAPTLDDACTRLIAMAKDRGGEDNITLVVAGVSGQLPRVDPTERISDTLESIQEYAPTDFGH